MKPTKPEVLRWIADRYDLSKSDELHIREAADALDALPIVTHETHVEVPRADYERVAHLLENPAAPPAPACEPRDTGLTYGGVPIYETTDPAFAGKGLVAVNAPPRDAAKGGVTIDGDPDTLISVSAAPPRADAMTVDELCEAVNGELSLIDGISVADHHAAMTKIRARLARTFKAPAVSEAMRWAINLWDADGWMHGESNKLGDNAGWVEQKRKMAAQAVRDLAALDSGASVVVDRRCNNETAPDVACNAELQDGGEGIGWTCPLCDVRDQRDALAAKLAEAERERDARAEQVDKLMQERDQVMVRLGNFCQPGEIEDRIRILQGHAGKMERERDEARELSNALDRDLTNARHETRKKEGEIVKLRQSIESGKAEAERLTRERDEARAECERINGTTYGDIVRPEWIDVPFTQPFATPVLLVEGAEHLRSYAVSMERCARDWRERFKQEASDHALAVGRLDEARDVLKDAEQDRDRAKAELARLRSAPPAIYTVDIEAAATDFWRRHGIARADTLNTLRRLARRADAEALASAITIEVREWPHDQCQRAARAALAHLGLALAQEPRDVDVLAGVDRDSIRAAAMHEAADILQRFALKKLQGPLGYQTYAVDWMGRAESEIREAASIRSQLEAREKRKEGTREG